MRYWTVKIGNRWVCVSLYQLIGVGIVSGIITFFSISAAFLSISSNINAGKLFKEKKKAEEIKVALKNMKLKIDSLNIKLDSVIDFDNKERMVWGLPNIGEDIRKLGVGGSKMDRSSPASAVKEAIQELERKIDFEVASFREIYDQIERKKKVLLHTPSIRPAEGTVTSGFGWRSLSGNKEFHKGLDISNSPGTPVVVTADGVVNYVGYNKGLGLTVEIDHGFGYSTKYGHLANASVKVGQYVKRGQIIGAIGTSGRVTGPHLHYEVHVLGKEVPPSNYIIPGTTTY